MRNFAKLLGIIAMVAVIGFSMTACGEEDIVRFDSALYGTWNRDTFSSAAQIYFLTDTEEDRCGFSDGTSNRLIAKNGNTYTFTVVVFTAVVGSDGKLTISESTSTYYVPNGTYTKQ
jgi:hypothetical protein